MSTCALIIEEWDDAQRGRSKISQRGVRFREVPIDGADDVSITPDGVPMSEIPVTDDLPRTQGLSSDAPDGIGWWNERCDRVVVATDEPTPLNDAFLYEERSRIRERPCLACDERQDFVPVSVDVEDARDAGEADLLEVSQQLVNGCRPLPRRPKNARPDARRAVVDPAS